MPSISPFIRRGLGLWLLLVGSLVGFASEKPTFTDYCQRLEQEIQGRKHGFMAGNLT